MTMFIDSFPIGYGHYSMANKDGDYINIDLYKGFVSIPINIINKIINNWGNNSSLNDIVSKNTYVLFDNNHLCVEDSKGCGIYWDLNTFKKYLLD